MVHVFGKHLTSVTVGRALNRDQWHNVVVTIDVHGARLIAKVDQLKEEVYLKVRIVSTFSITTVEINLIASGAKIVPFVSKAKLS